LDLSVGVVFDDLAASPVLFTSSICYPTSWLTSAVPSNNVTWLCRQVCLLMSQFIFFIWKILN
jgi:hypothetical protein